MNAERLQKQAASTQVQQRKRCAAQPLADHRQEAWVQAKLVANLGSSPEKTGSIQEKPSVQRTAEGEEELLQGKFTVQREAEEEEEAVQGKFGPVQRQEENRTGIPEPVKQRMEGSFGKDFSSVRVHPDSPKAPEMGALAYTQGTDIHFAPGQFKPDTSGGQQLLGHELAHVVQQAEGRVQPTTEIGGMAVNDDAALEREADVRGAEAVID